MRITDKKVESSSSSSEDMLSDPISWFTKTNKISYLDPKFHWTNIYIF